MVYLISFAVSVLFAYLAQNANRKSRRVLFLTISIATTVLLAGLRDVSVGTDTSHYYDNLWSEASKGRSLWDFMKFYHNYYPSREYVYAFLMDVSARLTGDFHVFLTLVHLIIIGFVYIGAFRLKEYASPSLVILLFYLFYYNHSLNIIRQYMAMAVLFAATADIFKRNFKRYILAVIIAIMMHNSAIIGILPLFLFWLMYPQNQLKDLSLQRRLVLYAGIVLLVLMIRPLGTALLNIGLISSKYLGYLESEGRDNYTAARILVILELIGIYMYIRPFRGKHPYADFFLISSFMFGVMYQIAFSISYGKRITAYYSLINLVSLGLLIQCPQIRSNTKIIRAAIIIVALAYWILMYAYLNTSRTMPYILGV